MHADRSQSRRHRIATVAGDSWPAAILLCMGACSYAVGRVSRDPAHGDAGALPLVVGLLLTPIAASLVVILLRVPQSLVLRFLLVFAIGAATFTLLSWL
jgi:hypothetical protein